ncbi:hypothetical protein GMO_07170 [Gluconobacter morbifer G707]|uniref:Uncharacterized protein n=1 Tax=Gluconobacter morbifer G707 TaxID=1088869 RepID=G6XGV2_9PROT|nr:hypothetical protein GMO_07170 [Gluconobacter morbifer G707]
MQVARYARGGFWGRGKRLSGHGLVPGLAESGTHIGAGAARVKPDPDRGWQDRENRHDVRQA